MENDGLWPPDAEEGCALEKYGGGATSSKRPIQLRNQPRREKKKMQSRQSKMPSHQSDLQTSKKDHVDWRHYLGAHCPKGAPKIMSADGSCSFRCLTPQEAEAKAKAEAAKAKDRANLFKQRVNLMAKLADRKRKHEAKLADAKKKEEAKLADAKKKEEAKLADAKKKEEAKLADAKKKEEAKLADAKETGLHRLVDCRNQHLLEPNLTWEQKVVYILEMVRRRELTEYNHKLRFHVPTRFCAYKIAFFDLDKESEGVPWVPIDRVPYPRHLWLADSVNVIAIKVAKSDRGYPISVFGTVLARDEYDYRCVYLFKRGRDDPQVITSKDDTLTLMGPYRALAVSDHMYFEFHLKVKGDGDVDEDFSKGFLVHSAVCNSEEPRMIDHLCSYLSTVELVYTPVPCAMEASFAVSILKGPSDFISKVTAWTTGNEENKIPVYNKEVAGVEARGSVDGLVAVPLDEKLVLRVCVSEHCEHKRGKCFQLALGHDINECLTGQEPYELQVKISWRGVVNRRVVNGRAKWGRPNMWCHVGGVKLLQ